MAAVIGNLKQEEKISKMGLIAHEMFTDKPLIIFKGIFRYGVESALAEHGYENWAVVAEKPSIDRKRFYESILNHSKKRLHANGLDESQIVSLFDKLRKANDSYLR